MAIQGVRDGLVSRNTAKYPSLKADGFEWANLDGYSRLTDAQVERIWEAVKADTSPFDPRLDLSCDEFVEWSKAQGRIQ